MHIHLICCLCYINTGCAAVFMWVCSAAYTVLLNYDAIATIHIPLIIKASRVMQLAVTERVRVDNVKRYVFLHALVFNAC